MHSSINVIITNIFNQLTSEAIKQGLFVTFDNLGNNIRLWHDRKLFYVFKVLGCVFDFQQLFMLTLHGASHHCLVDSSNPSNWPLLGIWCEDQIL